MADSLMMKMVMNDGSCFSFAMFHDVRIPRENLLNKTGDVSPDGRYITPFKVSLSHGEEAGTIMDVNGVVVWSI